jgi:hypothetical protein
VDQYVHRYLFTGAMDDKIQEDQQEQPAAQNLAPLRPPHLPKQGEHKHKRKLGKGELLFNLGTYGGIAWIENEIVSTAITSTIYESQAKPTDTFLKKLFKPNGFMHGPFEKTVGFLEKNVNPLKWARTPFYLAAEIFVMCLGGSLMVLQTKPMEDRKGKIVRKLDNFFTGGRGDEDPGIKRAHEEMDAEPKQSWYSQAGGRVGVIATATAMQFGIGAEKDGMTITGNPASHIKYAAPSTHLFKNETYRKYSNLGRAMTTGMRDLLSMKWIPGISAEQKALMKQNRANSLLPDGKFLWMQEGEGRIAMAMGNTFGFVLSVSAACATLFYVYSHAIAALREKKKHGNNGVAPQTEPATSQSTLAAEQTKKQDLPEKEQPGLKVEQVEHAMTLAQPAMAIGAPN